MTNAPPRASRFSNPAVPSKSHEQVLLPCVGSMPSLRLPQARSDGPRSTRRDYERRDQASSVPGLRGWEGVSSNIEAPANCARVICSSAYSFVAVYSGPRTMKVRADAHQQQKRRQIHAVVHRASEGGELASSEGGGVTNNHHASDIEAARAAFKLLGPANKNQVRVKPHPIKNSTEMQGCLVTEDGMWDGWCMPSRVAATIISSSLFYICEFRNPQESLSRGQKSPATSANSHPQQRYIRKNKSPIFARSKSIKASRCIEATL